MTDGDFEDRVGYPEPEESGDEVSTASAPPAVEKRRRRRLTRFCTVLLTVASVAYVVWLVVDRARGGGASRLSYPAASTSRYYERTLLFLDDLARRDIPAFLGGLSPGERAAAIDAAADELEDALFSWPVLPLAARLAVIHAEAGRLDDALELLSAFAGGESPEAEAATVFERVLIAAYRKAELDPALTRAELAFAAWILADLAYTQGVPWSHAGEGAPPGEQHETESREAPRDSWTAAVAIERLRETEAGADMAFVADAQRTGAAERANRIWAFYAGSLALIAAGLLAAALGILRWGTPRLGSAELPARWSLAQGWATFIRAEVFGVALLWAPVLVPVGPDTAGWVLTTIGCAPYFAWLIFAVVYTRWSLRFAGTSPARLFGLVNVARDRGDYARSILAFFGIPALGVLALALLLARWDDWQDAFFEPLIWGGASEWALWCVVFVVIAPLVEELIYRGVLYASLRTRFSPSVSALLSALVFGAVHPYSPAGVLGVVWTGVVLAVAYERTRSLVVPFVVHALINASFVVGTLVWYG